MTFFKVNLGDSVKKGTYSIRAILFKKNLGADLEDLKQEIEEATRKAFIEIYEKHKEENLYGFGLYSDQGAAAIFPTANTMGYLSNMNDTDIAYCKYDPAEWDCTIEGAGSQFSQICATLRSIVGGKEDNDRWFLMFRSVFYEICISTLQKLRKEGFFKKISGQDIFLTFYFTNEKFGNRKQIEIVKKLNDDAHQTEYLLHLKKIGII